MKYPWPLWVYPILLACLGQSGSVCSACSGLHKGQEKRARVNHSLAPVFPKVKNEKKLS